MFENTYVLLIILLCSTALFVIRRIYRAFFREEVTITTLRNGAPPLNIGILDYSNNSDDGVNDRNEVAVVRITGASFDTPYIGRVLVDNNQRAIVHVIDSDLELEAENPFYKTCGYVDEHGFVHEIVKGRDMKVGFMAQPSAPDTPTIIGERHWYSFWKRELNAYSGKPKNKKDNNDKEKEPSTDNTAERTSQLVAKCVRKGFHIGEKDLFPSEARACGYALFFKKKRTVNNYSDYYNNPSNLWKDTALLAAIVYSVFYLFLFLINTQVLRIPLFGRDIYGMCIVSCFYFIVWALVRELKIKKSEWSSSIKPQLDLLNKSIGIRLTDRMITVLASILISLCMLFYNLESLMSQYPLLADFVHAFTNFTHYDFDFLPLVNAIFIGVTINRTQRFVPLPWKINSELEEDDESEAGTDVVKNPKGRIDITYDWQLDSFNDVTLHGRVTLHFNKEEYIDLLRQDNPFRPQVLDHLTEETVRDMFRYLLNKPHAGEHLNYLAYYINDIADRKHLSNIDRLQFALDFVQEPNILYREVHGSKSLDFPINYMRFPDETLYDKEGDFNCKAFLAACLYYKMGADVFFLYSDTYKTAAVAVETPYADLLRYINSNTYADVVLDRNGKKFLFCDVVCDVNKLGHIEEGKSIRDFDVKIDFFHSDEEQHEDLNTDEIDHALPPSVTKDVAYQWNLDSLFGPNLRGEFKLHFEEDYIDKLRTSNPYASVNSGLSNKELIEEMYAYMRTHEETLSNLKKLADYIRHTISENKLSKADSLQFILDFVQEPNIKYGLDSNSVEIGNRPQYVRFPDETLYDKSGDCDCKTMLASLLFKECGFDTLFLASSVYQHAALAIECDKDMLEALATAKFQATTLSYLDETFLFCETTGDGYKIGQIAVDEKIELFDLVIPVK
ncbi:MAG: hypothetical protein J5875_03135 [Paludibacteraceae bacterium]|nr:hypothetical protein [Paludibacteraceae bacterium]